MTKDDNLHLIIPLLVRVISRSNYNDPTNEMATGLCLEPIEGTGQYIVDTKVTLDIADATGKWSCAYLNGARLTAGSDNSFVQNPDTTIVGSSNLFVTPVESKIMGTVIIPRSTGC